MATLSVSRSSLCSTMPWRATNLASSNAELSVWSNTSARHLNHYNESLIQQDRLLASLAPISQSNMGWIFIANAPAPLSRQALVRAGVNPARVIDAKQASAKLIQQAINSTSIAAVICWEGAQITHQFLKSTTQQSIASMTH